MKLAFQPIDPEQMASPLIRPPLAAPSRWAIAAAAVAALGFFTHGAQAQPAIVKASQVGTNPRSFQILVTGSEYQTDGGRNVVFQMVDGNTGQLLASNSTTLNRACGISTDVCTASTTFTSAQISSGRFCMVPASTLRFGTYLSVDQDAPSKWTTFVFPACP